MDGCPEVDASMAPLKEMLSGSNVATDQVVMTIANDARP
jgi:hypothetical protein